jgi:hypothetical protein
LFKRQKPSCLREGRKPVTILATAQQDELLDAICWRVLGTTAGGVVEQALDAQSACPRRAGGRGHPGHPARSAANRRSVSTLDTTNLWD